jgi:hypothetical protein
MAAIPAIPSNAFTQQANGDILVSWDIMPGATSYVVQYSTDPTGLTIAYTTLASPTANQYKYTAGTLGTTYYFQVASVNSSGTSSYCTYVSSTPSQSGEMTLGEIRQRSQEKADRVNSKFLSTAEWNYNINNSLFELYDILIDAYEDQFLSPPYMFSTNGSTSAFPLPDGVTTFTNNFTNVVEAAPPFYKLWGVDLAANTSPTGWVTMNKYNPLDRNKYFYPNSQSTIYGVFNAQYRVLGNNIEFIPIPSGNQYIRIRYFPRLTMLLADNDLTTAGVSGWLEYVIVDAAIKALMKEESDVSVLMQQKDMLKKRIEAGAKNRDAGRPDTIQDTRSGGTGGWNTGGYGGFQAGF